MTVPWSIVASFSVSAPVLSTVTVPLVLSTAVPWSSSSSPLTSIAPVLVAFSLSSALPAPLALSCAVFVSVPFASTPVPVRSMTPSSVTAPWSIVASFSVSVEPASTCTVPSVLVTVSPLSTSVLLLVALSVPVLVMGVSSISRVPPLASNSPELVMVLGSMVSVPPVASNVPVLVTAASVMELVPLALNVPPLPTVHVATGQIGVVKIQRAAGDVHLARIVERSTQMQHAAGVDLNRAGILARPVPSVISKVPAATSNVAPATLMNVLTVPLVALMTK